MTTAPKRRWPRFTLRTLFVVVTVFLSVGGAAFYVYYSVNSSVRNAYAAWWVADMVVDHMKAHDGTWPKGWDDLADSYETCVHRSGRPWTFEELRDRVDLDWGADPKDLIDAKTVDQSPPFRVIWLRDGSDTHWSGAEPNRIVLEYLQQRRTAQE